MKKQFFYAALAIALMSSCSKDNDPGTTTDPTDPTVPEVIDDTTPAAIQLGIGNPTIIATRGTGSVGDITGSNGNVWNGQELSIYMFPKGTVAEYADSPLAGLTFNAPTNTATGAITNSTHAVKYYPMQGAFDFYGYHMDTKNNETPSTPTEDWTTANTLKVNATIDGTNDVMAAKADLTIADKVVLINKKLGADTYKASDDGTKVVAVADGTTEIAGEDLATLNAEIAKAFSSYAARRTIQPNLIFKHLLSRLKFNVIAGEEQAAIDQYGAGKKFPAVPGHKFDPNNVNETDMTDGAVYIKKIALTDPKSNVSIVFTPNSFTLEAVAATPGTSFVLKQRAAANTPAAELEALSPVAPAKFIANASRTDENKTDWQTPVGESMMVVPGETTLKLEIEVAQYKITTEAHDGQEAQYAWMQEPKPLTATVKAPTNTIDGATINTFEAGKSYNVNITVFGYQKIEVTATLEGWINGGDIDVNPEDEAFTPVI